MTGHTANPEYLSPEQQKRIASAIAYLRLTAGQVYRELQKINESTVGLAADREDGGRKLAERIEQEIEDFAIAGKNCMESIREALEDSE